MYSSSHQHSYTDIVKELLKFVDSNAEHKVGTSRPCPIPPRPLPHPRTPAQPPAIARTGIRELRIDILNIISALRAHEAKKITVPPTVVNNLIQRGAIKMSIPELPDASYGVVAIDSKKCLITLHSLPKDYYVSVCQYTSPYGKTAMIPDLIFKDIILEYTGNKSGGRPLRAAYPLPGVMWNGDSVDKIYSLCDGTKTLSTEFFRWVIKMPEGEELVALGGINEDTLHEWQVDMQRTYDEYQARHTFSGSSEGEPHVRVRRAPASSDGPNDTPYIRFAKIIPEIIDGITPTGDINVMLQEPNAPKGKENYARLSNPPVVGETVVLREVVESLKAQEPNNAKICSILWAMLSDADKTQILT